MGDDRTLICHYAADRDRPLMGLCSQFSHHFLDAFYDRLLSLTSRCIVAALECHGQASVIPGSAGRGIASDFGLLRNLQGIIHFYAQVSDRALQPGMTKQQLYRAQVLGASVDERHLGPSHSMGSILAGL